MLPLYKKKKSLGLFLFQLVYIYLKEFNSVCCLLNKLDPHITEHPYSMASAKTRHMLNIQGARFPEFEGVGILHGYPVHEKSQVPKFISMWTTHLFLRHRPAFPFIRYIKLKTIRQLKYKKVGHTFMYNRSRK